MSITTLISNIDRQTTYPVTQTGSAASNTGLLCLVLTNTWTEQMLAELPTIEVNVYMPDGTRLITISIDMTTVNRNTHTATEPYAIPLYNLPSNFTFSIAPLFDKFAIQSHNAQIETGDFTAFNTSETGIVDTNPEDYTGLLWTTPTSNFEVDILWNDTNVASGGVDVDSEITPGSNNPPSSDAVYNYVNNAVATNTAYFIGTFNSLSELEAYSGAVSNNDYAFVIREYTLLTSQPSDWTTNFTSYYTRSTIAPTWEADKYYSKSGDTYTLTTSEPANWSTNYTGYYTVFNETDYRSVVGVDTYTAIPSGTVPTFAQNTYYEHGSTYYDRYKYNADNDAWQYEYSLEFTQLTKEQWATINSGLTPEDKTKLVNLANVPEITGTATSTGAITWRFSPSADDLIKLQGLRDGDYSEILFTPVISSYKYHIILRKTAVSGAQEFTGYGINTYANNTVDLYTAAGINDNGYIVITKSQITALDALTAGTAISLTSNVVGVKVGDGLTTDASGNLKTTIVGEIMSETAYSQLATKTADVYFTYD